MIYFARYHRILKAIQISARKEWSGGNAQALHSSPLGEKTPNGRRWDPPYAPQEQPPEPAEQPTED